MAVLSNAATACAAKGQWQQAGVPWRRFALQGVDLGI